MIIKVKRHPEPAREEPKKRIIIRKHGARAKTPPPPPPPPKPAPPPDAAIRNQTTRVVRKLNRDTPPNVRFLRFESIIGRGGMSVVWRAWHLELERYVAVKVLDADFAASGQDIRQFMHEVRTISSLHHPGIVQGYGSDFADGRYFMIMDFVDGYTFGSLLNRKKSIPESDALVICEAVADAMKYAWDSFRIVHCDIKPENIMVDSDGTVKITDLGLCRSTIAINANRAQAEEVVGTPAYMSPEQIYGDAVLDCRADIYSLGASLYHLVTGRTLFPLPTNDDILRAHVAFEYSAPDPRTIAPSLSAGFTTLLARMLVKDKACRYADWDEVFADAERVERGEIPSPPPPGASSSIQLLS